MFWHLITKTCDCSRAVIGVKSETITTTYENEAVDRQTDRQTDRQRNYLLFVELTA